MTQTVKKIRVKPVTPEEGMNAIGRGLEGIETATRGQLQASLVGIAESFIEMTTDCPNDETRYALVMEIVANTLAENQEAVDLDELVPVSENTN